MFACALKANALQKRCIYGNKHVKRLEWCHINISRLKEAV